MSAPAHPYASVIAGELNLAPRQVENTLKLLSEGATIPFIARYRKEMTGSLDEVMLIRIRDRLRQLTELDKRRETILASIQEQGKLTPELENQIRQATTLPELEDIYLPYKPKRKTRASIAKEKGLEPLATLIFSQQYIDPVIVAEKYINPELGVLSAEEALSGARDIMAEWINEHKYGREEMRRLFLRKAYLQARIMKDKEEEGVKYRDYYDYREQMAKAPSHRVLAIFRGEKEEFLRVTIAPEEYLALQVLERIFIRNNSKSAEQVRVAMQDSYKRLLQPSMETEMREWVKEMADRAAIQVFAENLNQLLLAPPLGQKNVMAIDPGFKTGCKVVCLDRQGNLLHNETIYPHPPHNEIRQSIPKILNLVDAYKVEAIAIGNGTAGRETEYFIRRVPFDKDILAIMVNESGASVYSASSVAREEFPDYDVTVRGAVSIGRRLMDPLAELVKIDPKSIGVGQYQHDVDQSKLKDSLEDVVVSCVNAVGVEVNTASKELLTYVSGVGPSLAQKIVDFRREKGPFGSREELKKIPRFGARAFEQAAGFLRIQQARNPLDRSAVHPESYHIVEAMSKSVGAGSVEEIMKNESLRNQIRVKDFISETVGLPTLHDIMQELARPGRDPRQKFELFEFDKTVHSINDLVPGSVLPGIVTNITKFGAFVDIGVHQDGLVHISQLADKFVSDPSQVVKINQKVNVRVLEVDIERKRIQLSMKNTNTL
ncbi:MAG TPA: Tex family protein [Bacteroidales bacterium]|nr:Tex family protein [Bacteroidales bacterium]